MDELNYWDNSHNSTYWLVNAYQLDSDYNHAPMFSNSSNQLQWFNERTIKVLDNSMYHRKNDESNVVVYEALDQLKLVNYLVILNDDGTKYFYFVIDKEYNDMSTTTLQLQLDLIQTYMFNLNFTQSLVEREHDTGWVPYPSIGLLPPTNYTENLEIGEYELYQKHNIYDYTGKGTYLIVSSDMLGVSDDKRPDENSPSPSGGDNYKEHLLDENGVVLLKHFEGFRSQAYQDINGYWTIGYGVTQANYPAEYASLEPSCTEAEASEVMGDIVTPNFALQVYNRVVQNFGEEWLNQHRFNALVSYVWQWGNLDSGGLWQVLVDNKDDNEALYNAYYSLGQSQGYVYRRQKEAEVFAYGNYGEMPIGTGSGVLQDNDGKGFIPTQFK